jgi:hypothetical protein
MLSERHYETMRAASWEEVDKLEWPTHFHRKTMIAAFFNGRWEYFLNILPRSRSMDTKSSAEEIVGGLEMAVIPKAKIHRRGESLFILTVPP